MDMRVAWLGAAVLFLTVGTGDAEAQWRDRGPYPRERPEFAGWAGVNFVGADPIGEFGEVVEQGFGLAVNGALPVTRDGALRLRAEGGFVIYGHEKKNLCFPAPVGCRIGLDLTTNNSIFFLGAGPELALPGRSIEPYVNATGGFSYFATTSSLSGDDEWDDWGDTRNFSDFVGALTVGGGIRARITHGRTPVSIDMGLRYHRNGVAEYLREGDIVDEDDGSITIYPNRSEANLVTYRIGVSVAIPRGDDRKRERGYRGR